MGEGGKIEISNPEEGENIYSPELQESLNLYQAVDKWIDKDFENLPFAISDSYRNELISIFKKRLNTLVDKLNKSKLDGYSQEALREAKWQDSWYKALSIAFEKDKDTQYNGLQDLAERAFNGEHLPTSQEWIQNPFNNENAPQNASSEILMDLSRDLNRVLHKGPVAMKEDNQPYSSDESRSHILLSSTNELRNIVQDMLDRYFDQENTNRERKSRRNISDQDIYADQDRQLLFFEFMGAHIAYLTMIKFMGSYDKKFKANKFMFQDMTSMIVDPNNSIDNLVKDMTPYLAALTEPPVV